MPQPVSFRVAWKDVEPKGFDHSDKAARAEFKLRVARYVAEAKDAELAKGLDRHGKEMAALAPATVKRRRSAMGPADPTAPPLTPAYGLSRTRALLAYRAHDAYLLGYWRSYQGQHWGKVLGYHRAGSARLPVRDVIGLSPESLAKVKQRITGWWGVWKKTKAQPPAPPAAPAAKGKGPAQVAYIPPGHLPKKHAFGKILVYEKPGPSQAQAQAPPAPAPAPYSSPVPTAPPRVPKPAGRPAPPPMPVSTANSAVQHFVAGRRLPKPSGRPAPPPMPVSTAATPPPAPPKKPKAPPKPKFAWPKDPNALPAVKKLGGSTGAELVEDAAGNLYVRKKGSSPGHLREESYADAAYRALGVNVPESVLIDTPAGPVKLAKFLPGTTTLGELLRTDPAAGAAALKEVRKHFVADALLGNWDVAGQGLDNVLVDAAGKVYRIDNGGALRYRAQGGSKGHLFGPNVGELKSLLDPSVNPNSAKVFAGITQKEILAQAKAVLKKKAALLKALPPALRPEVEARLDYLDKKVVNPPPDWAKGYKAFSAADQPVTPADVKAMDDYGKQVWGAWAQKLAPAERSALLSYKGSGYTPINDSLRFGTPAPPAVRQNIAEIDRTIGRTTVPEDTVMFRGVRDLKKMGLGDPAFRVGRTIQDQGFMSVSVNHDASERFTYGPAPGMFRIKIPKGTPAAYLELLNHMSEYEVLLARGSKLKVVRVGEYDRGGQKIPMLDVELAP